MLAVAFGEAIDAGAVNRNEIVLIEQPVAFERFFANQNFDQTSDALLHLLRFKGFENGIERIAVRRVADSEQPLEVGCGGRVVSEFERDLATCSQLTKEHQKSREEQAGQGIDDPGGIAGIGDSRQVTIGRAKEVRSRCQCDVQQGLHLLLRQFKRSRPGDFGGKRKKLGDDFGVCGQLSMIRLGHS